MYNLGVAVELLNGRGKFKAACQQQPYQHTQLPVPYSITVLQQMAAITIVTFSNNPQLDGEKESHLTIALI